MAVGGKGQQVTGAGWDKVGPVWEVFVRCLTLLETAIIIFQLC